MTILLKRKNILSKHDLILEFIEHSKALSTDSISTNHHRTFIDSQDILDTLNNCAADQLLQIFPDCFETTAKGKNFLNDLLLNLFRFQNWKNPDGTALHKWVRLRQDVK